MLSATERRFFFVETALVHQKKKGREEEEVKEEKKKKERKKEKNVNFRLGLGEFIQRMVICRYSVTQRLSNPQLYVLFHYCSPC